MSDEAKMKKVTGYISEKVYKRMMNYSYKHRVPMSRLVGIAIDNEYCKEDQAWSWDVELPKQSYVDYTYAEEGGKILNYLREQRQGMGLDLLLIARHDIGVPDKDIFLAAFKELASMKLVESFKPLQKKFSVPYADDYVHWCITGETPKKKKTVRKKATQYETYQRLKKQFGDQ